MLTDILIQLLGFVGITLGILALQFNTHKNIVLFKTLAEIPYLIQYIFLDAYVGMVMGVIGITRNLIFKHRVSKNQSNKPFIILFCFITLIAGIFTIALSWNQTLSVMNKFSTNYSIKTLLAIVFSSLSIFAKILTTIAYGIKEPKILRRLNLPASILWLVYNFVFFSISGILHEIFVTASIIVAMIRFRNSPSNNEPKLNESNKSL